MRAVIIDTDPGHDDALAIMLAVKSGFFDIRAITTVAGNSGIENTTRNARYVLQLLEAEHIPVYSGAEKPLKGALVKAVVHGESGLEGINPTNDPQLNGKAVEKILQIVKENPHQITIVTLGPLTNIAMAIQKDAETMKLVKEIVIMGGAITVPGNKNRVAEFNIFVDPVSADIVFTSSIKKTLIPLDVCNRVKLQIEDFQKITNAILREPILCMMRPYIENITADEGIKAALMYDPLTVYSLINTDACQSMEYSIAVETEGNHTRGMTVADLRTKKDSEPNVTVITSISEEVFKADFIKYLSK